MQCGYGVDVSSLVREVAGEVVPGASADVPLMEAGLDSLGAVELRTRLCERLSDDDLSETLVFDYPTLRQLEAHLQARRPAASAAVAPPGGAAAGVGNSALLAQLLGSLAAGSTVPVPRDPSSIAAQVAASSGPTGLCLRSTSTSCSLPGSVHDLTSLAHLTASACDSIVTVPATRWDTASPPEGVDAGLADRAQHGGFISCAECFDRSRFGLSESEVTAMDPQQRLLLEQSYSALHASGASKVSLLGSGVGIATGIYATEFMWLLEKSPLRNSVYVATGAALSIASGRVAFVLGLQGPCASFETACSASLVACHTAVRALQHVECDSHLVMGANLMLLQFSSLWMGIAGMTSLAGKCHTQSHSNHTAITK